MLDTYCDSQKNHGPKFLPPGWGPESVLPGGMAQLQVPSESLMATKLKIFQQFKLKLCENHQSKIFVPMFIHPPLFFYCDHPQIPIPCTFKMRPTLVLHNMGNNGLIPLSSL